MEVKMHDRGKLAGSINIISTVESLGVGETWNVSEEIVDWDYARSVCCRIRRRSGMKFTVSNPARSLGVIKITRVE